MKTKNYILYLISFSLITVSIFAPGSVRAADIIESRFSSSKIWPSPSPYYRTTISGYGNVGESCDEWLLRTGQITTRSNELKIYTYYTSGLINQNSTKPCLMVPASYDVINRPPITSADCVRSPHGSSYILSNESIPGARPVPYINFGDKNICGYSQSVRRQELFILKSDPAGSCYNIKEYSSAVYATAPTTNLCASGNASAVTTSGTNWYWSCTTNYWYGGSSFDARCYALKSLGTVNVSVAGLSAGLTASWTITGPETITGNGLSGSYTARATGTYTIIWGNVSGYTKPATQTLTLLKDGSISFTGNYTYAPVSCALAWGGTVASGQTQVAFNATLPCGNSCDSIKTTATCTNGVWSVPNFTIDYPNQTCPAETCASCSIPASLGGGTIASGQTQVAFKDTRPCGAICDSIKATATCTNGVWSVPNFTIDYLNQTCPAETCASCSIPASLGGGTLSHGGVLEAFTANSATCSLPCVKKDMICINGSINADAGSFQSCSPALGCSSGTVSPGRYIEVAP